MSEMNDAVEARAASLLRDATVRWLVKEELAFLLLHHARLGVPILRQLQLRPASGRLLLYDTRDVPDFKKDGWRWQKRKDQSGRVREDRAKLVINREVIVLGTYVHSSDVATFHRRSYTLRDADPHIVLVHYFDEVHKAAHASSSAMATAAAMGVSAVAPSLIASAAQKPSAKGLKRALPVSIRPVATAAAMAMPATSAPQFPLSTAQKQQTATMLTESATEETVDAIMSNCFELDFLQPPASRLDAQPFSHTDDSSSSSVSARDGDFDLLRSSGMLMDGLADFGEDLLYPVEATSAASCAQTAALKLEPAPDDTAAAATVVTPAQISDFSPDWDFTDGGAKVLICLASPLPLCAQEGQRHMFVQFGILNRVPAEQLSDTVVRCTAPPSNATGSKEIYVCCSRDQLHPECTQLSSKRLFTYKSPHPQPSPALSAAPNSAGVEPLHELHLEPSTTASGMDAMASGKRGRSPRRLDEQAEMRDALRRQRSDRLSESSNLSSFVDTDLDERQCKIRVVERLSEFHHAIWTTASPGELLGVQESSSFLLPNTAAGSSATGSREPPVSQRIAPSPQVTVTLENTSYTPGGAGELLPMDSSSASLLGLDDSTIETLSDQDLEQLSEKLLERVVRQLVTVAHTSEELLEELNSLDEAGLSLLHYVSFYNYSQLVPLLLSHGAHVNQQSTQGQTALHLAAGCGHRNVVDVLVQSGADVFALDFDGFTAADRADKSGHLDVAASLQQLMGMRTPDDAAESTRTPEYALQHSVATPSLDAFAMDIDFGSEPDAIETTVMSDSMGSPSRMGESAGDAPGVSAKSKNYVGENHEHNRKLLLGAFSTMSLHDKCALSLSISRDPSSMSSRRRGSSISDDTAGLGSVGSTTSSGGGTGAGPSAAGTPLRSLTSSPARFDASDATAESVGRENDSLCDSDVKSVIADDEESLTKLEAAMELMGPEERQSLEDEVKLLQHNIRAWLLKRNCKHMRETTKRLHEATQTIADHHQQQQLEHVATAAATAGPGGAAGSSAAPLQQGQSAALSERERAAVTVQAATRSMLARKSFLQTKNVTIKVQAATRGVLCRKHFARMKTHALASLVIQRNVREWWYKQQPSASRTSALASKSDSRSSVSSPLVSRTSELRAVVEQQDEDDELAQRQ